jgi:hypothetical protein
VVELWTIQITPHYGFNYQDRWICITIYFKVNGFWGSNSCSIKEHLLLSLLVATNGTACVICSLDSTKSTIKLARRIRFDSNCACIIWILPMHETLQWSQAWLIQCIVWWFFLWVA